jgi:KEOPS complex subunit Cgi121
MKLVEGVAEIDDLQAFLDRLTEIGGAHGCTVQAFDARYVVSQAHLRRAVELADRAIERGNAVARDRGVEILLYAAGSRQIDRALTLGVEEGECPVVVLVSEPLNTESPPEQADGATAEQTATESATAPTDAEIDAAEAVEQLLTLESTLGEFDPERVCTFFEIGDREREVVDGDLRDLVLERVALLDVEK